MMRLQVRFLVIAAAVAGLALCAGAPIEAQGTSPSSSSSSSQQPTAVQAEDQAPPAPEYIQVDPLAKVRYDNRYDLSVGMAYDHMKAGPNLLQGSNLGGLDVSGSYWLTRNWGIEASGRGYVGTSGAAPNDANSKGGPIKGPFVSEYFFTGGLQWLGPHNKHGALIAHVLAGGVDGIFQKDLLGNPPSVVGFYNNQIAPAVIVGGHMDLNRSDHWVFRITPDAIWTRYSINYPPNITQNDINFAISVGAQYKFTRAKRSTRKANWVSGW
jgi:hypothetical protein